VQGTVLYWELLQFTGECCARDCTMLRHTTQNPTMLLYALLWTVLCHTRLSPALDCTVLCCAGPNLAVRRTVLCWAGPLSELLDGALPWTVLRYTMHNYTELRTTLPGTALPRTVLCYTMHHFDRHCFGLCCAIMAGHAVGDAEQRRAPPYPAPDCAMLCRTGLG